MRVQKDQQSLVLRGVTWGQRSNKQICCLAYNYGLKTHGNLKLIELVCLGMLLQ